MGKFRTAVYSFLSQWETEQVVVTWCIPRHIPSQSDCRFILVLNVNHVGKSVRVFRARIWTKNWWLETDQEHWRRTSILMCNVLCNCNGTKYCDVVTQLRWFLSPQRDRCSLYSQGYNYTPPNTDLGYFHKLYVDEIIECKSDCWPYVSHCVHFVLISFLPCLCLTGPEDLTVWGRQSVIVGLPTVIIRHTHHQSQLSSRHVSSCHSYDQCPHVIVMTNVLMS